MKKFLMLLAVSYIPGLLLLFGEWPEAAWDALWVIVISILLVPYFTAWAVIGPLCDVMGWLYIADEWQKFIYVVSYILYIAVGLVFLMVDERRARWTAFAFYVVLVLLSIYGLHAWFWHNME